MRCWYSSLSELRGKEKMENIIAQNEHVTLRELRTQISATSEGKLPTFKQLMEMKSAVVAQKVVNTALLTVYQNGYAVYEADEDAVYDEEYTIDLSTLRPTVSFPHLPENTKTIDEIKDVKIDQVVIGSCTNGRIDDLRIAASILKGKKVKKGLRVIIIPATQHIYLQAMEEGLLKVFIEAGAVVSTPTCGPCLGGYMGILAAGERCVSTTNRNFVGRMGHVESEVYLASPAVAAASAITGEITDPEAVA